MVVLAEYLLSLPGTNT
ncbi:unnamed protein product, partial [Allacma fusca]